MKFYSYVKFKKVRKTYKKLEGDLTYNIMLDMIENIGSFIEFEILIEREEIKDIDINEKFNAFFKKINVDLKEATFSAASLMPLFLF